MPGHENARGSLLTEPTEADNVWDVDGGSWVDHEAGKPEGHQTHKGRGADALEAVDVNLLLTPRPSAREAILPYLIAALLFGFGGMTSLGANILVMGIPAVFCHHVFGRYIRAKGPESVFAPAFAAGASGILIAWLVLGSALVVSGEEYTVPAFTVLLWHVPIVAIEGFVTASAVSFLHRIRPAALGVPFGAATPLEAAAT